MKFLLDFFPLVFFFIAYKLQGIYVGTAVLMAATALQMLVVYWNSSGPCAAKSALLPVTAVDRKSVV